MTFVQPMCEGIGTCSLDKVCAHGSFLGWDTSQGQLSLEPSVGNIPRRRGDIIEVVESVFPRLP